MLLRRVLRRWMYVYGADAKPRRMGDAVRFPSRLLLKAGGVGITLTRANHVCLMDPWWNPAVEEQAVDRVYRLGQQRAVKVLRFVAGGTIEERIMDTHEDKRSMANLALTRGRLDAASKAKQQAARMDRVRSLLS
mmetsp:Transcript_16492/g.50502  ORF Transcript_16492/g.50502 Transcript_16492/m.50502 type:complete len:135 (+) Transcript_16492:2513-2917(+)